MRYLFVHASREWSGSARAVAAAARGLAERGHQVTVAVEPDSTVERIVSHVAAIPGRGPLFAVEPLTLHQSWMRAAWELRALARRVGADVVFVQGNREQLVAAVARRLGSRANLVRRVPVGATMAINRSGRVATSLAPTYFLFGNDADARATVLPRRAIGHAVAPLGVRSLDALLDERDTPDETVSGPMAGDPYIVCLHDASSRSRAATAIRTVAMLSTRHPRLQLVIVGEGAYDDDLRMQAASLRALNLVHFLGDRDDALHVMRGALLGWVVSDGDTAAYGILDLMSLGVPALAGERTVAERYVLSDITGVLLPPHDAFETAAVVAELLAKPAQRETMGDAARSRVVREFPEQAMIDGFERAAAAAVRGRHA